jgi:hypothetical protein
MIWGVWVPELSRQGESFAETFPHINLLKNIYIQKIAHEGGGKFFF